MNDGFLHLGWSLGGYLLLYRDARFLHLVLLKVSLMGAVGLEDRDVI